MVTTQINSHSQQNNGGIITPNWCKPMVRYSTLIKVDIVPTFPCGFTP